MKRGPRSTTENRKKYKWQLGYGIYNIMFVLFLARTNIKKNQRKDNEHNK